MGITFKLIKEIGTIGTTTKGEKKLQLVSWNKGEPTYDLRTWLSDGKATSGLTLSKEELLRIVELYGGEGTKKEEVKTVEKPKKTSKAKASTKTTVKTTSKKEEAKEQKTEIKKQKKEETKEPVKEKVSVNVSDYNEKLDLMFEKVKDNPDYGYVLTGIKELAVVDNDFAQNIMQECKTFEGMMSYAMNHSKEVGFMNGSCCVIDNDSMLGLCLDYFNEKEESTKTEKSKKK